MAIQTLFIGISVNLPDIDTLESLDFDSPSLFDYDIVIADVPTQITFQNAQFQQAIEMRKFGVAIPDDEMVKMSTLARKNDIAKKISKGAVIKNVHFIGDKVWNVLKKFKNPQEQG